MDQVDTQSPPATARVSVPELDRLLGRALKVLDDGFVRVVDYLGGDASIVQAARVSYGSGTKKVQEDRALIRYLMRHRHSTPFEMCEIKFHVRIPMDSWRQWIRHRTANVNEYSTRYSLAIDAAQATDPGDWRTQSSQNNQGSDGFLSEEAGIVISEEEQIFQAEARRVYESRIKKGVAREQARKDLPLSTYTEAYWKIDLHNLLHFLALRMDSHAQREIRDYACLIGDEIVAKWVPSVWEAFKDYRLKAICLTRLEIEILREIITQGDPIATAKHFGWLNSSSNGKGLKRNRERQECEVKFANLGVKCPW